MKKTGKSFQSGPNLMSFAFIKGEGYKILAKTLRTANNLCLFQGQRRQISRKKRKIVEEPIENQQKVQGCIKLHLCD